MKTRKEIDEAIEGAEYISGMGSFIGLGGEPIATLFRLARLGASVAEPREEEIEAMAYALFREGFHKDDWGDGEGRGSVVAEKWREWSDERERCKRHALAALLALKERANV